MTAPVEDIAALVARVRTLARIEDARAVGLTKRLLAGDKTVSAQDPDNAERTARTLHEAATALSQAEGRGGAEGVIEALRGLYAVVDELDGDLDEQSYDARARDDFDSPDDAEFGVNVTAGQMRGLTKALHVAALALASSPPPPSPPEGER